jgi:L-aminopeptidase/D-esterase-like protein
MAVLLGLGGAWERDRERRNPASAVRNGVERRRMGGTPWDAAGNTTLCLVATDAPLDDADLLRMVRLASTALPRRITPVFTPFDGDVIFGVVPDGGPGPGEPLSPADVLALGVAAREALERALLRAVGYEP